MDGYSTPFLTEKVRITINPLTPRIRKECNGGECAALWR